MSDDMKIKDAIHWVDIARMGYICDPNECGLEKDGDPCRAFHCDEIHDALVMAIKVLEKQVPEKPKHIDKNDEFDGNWIKVCPACGMKFVERFTTEDMSYPRIYHKAKYCECGQAIDWSDAE